MEEELQAIAVQTVANAKSRKAFLTEKALRCHDALVQKERQLSALQRLLQEQERELSALQQEVDVLRQQKSHLVAEIKQEGCIIAFDPECDWNGYEDCEGRRILQRAWNGLSPKKKWKKDTIVTIFYRYFATGKQLPWSFLKESWYEDAPKSILDDRDLVLCCLSINYRSLQFFHIDVDDEPLPSLFFKTDQFWHDKAIFVAAVKVFPKLLRKEAVPDHFLDDEDVFLAYTGVEDTGESWATRPWRDENFRGLVLRFSARIRSNFKLMLALAKMCGLCLQYIDKSLKDNLELIQASCEQNIVAWSCVGPEAQLVLLKDKVFVERVLKGYPYDYRPWYQQLYQQLYESLPETLQCDRGIVGIILTRGIFYPAIDELPSAVPRDRDFWLSACHHLDLSLWQQLPAEFHSDTEFMEHFRFESGQAVERVLRDCPHFAANRTFWASVIKSDMVTGNGELRHLIPHATVEIRSDQELMLFACKEDAPVYGVLDTRLQEDRLVLETAIESACSIDEIFFQIPLHVQNMHPELSLKALKQVEDSYVRFDQIAGDLLLNPKVAKAFIDNRNSEELQIPPLPLGFPDALKNNEDFVLSVLEHCREPAHFQAFSSAALHSSKTFMMKAVARNPVCLAAGTGNLSQDFDLATMAFSHQIYERGTLFGRHVHNEDYDEQSERKFLYSIAAKAREKVFAFEGFTQGFLYGFVENAGPDCALSMLVRDNETTRSLKELIAEFAGVPSGEEVGRLRAASLNLLFMCMPDPENLSIYCMATPGLAYCGPGMNLQD